MFFIMTGLNQGLIDGKVDQLPLYDLQSILLVILTYFGNGIVPAILFNSESFIFKLVNPGFIGVIVCFSFLLI